MKKLNWRHFQHHPVVTLFAFFASIVTVLGFVLSLRANNMEQTTTRADPCAEVVGRWDWLNTGGIVSVAEGGLLTWHPTIANPIPAVTGTWQCDRNNGVISLNWNTGLSDTMQLQEDGNRLSGNNDQNGTIISATRSN